MASDSCAALTICCRLATGPDRESPSLQKIRPDRWHLPLCPGHSCPDNAHILTLIEADPVKARLSDANLLTEGVVEVKLYGVFKMV